MMKLISLRSVRILHSKIIGSEKSIYNQDLISNKIGHINRRKNKRGENAIPVNFHEDSHGYYSL